MKQSEKLTNKYQELRNRIVAEIMLLVKQHVDDHEVLAELPDPIFYASGIDEQDNPHEINEVTEKGEVVIYYQGDETERFPMEQLSTEKLIEVLEGLEKSYENLTQ